MDDSTKVEPLSPREQLVTSLTESLRELTLGGDVEGAEVALDALRRLVSLSKRSAPLDRTARVTPLRPIKKGT